MAEPDEPVNLDDLSPSLGGERAPEEEIPADAGQSSTGGPFSGEFADLFGTGTQAELESLMQNFGLFGQTLQSLVTETMQVIETRLPQTLAAFEGLIDAVNQALDETQAGHSATNPTQPASEVQDQDA